MKGWYRKLEHLVKRLLGRVFLVLRKIHLPGFKGISLYEVLKFFVEGLSDGKFSLIAAAMAYNFFFSLFPAIILMFTVLAWLPVPDLQDRILEFFANFIPESGMVLIREIVSESLKKMGIGVIGLNVFLALRWAVRGFTTMTRAFSKDVEAFRKRNLFQTYGVALLLFLVLAGLFIAAISVLVIGEYMVHFLESSGWISQGFDLFLLKGFNYVISLVLMIFSISAIYHFGPSSQKRWKFFTPGSFVASILTMLTIIGFSFFFSNFSDFNKLYGSLAAIILLMLWFYYISIVLLLGFELNAAIDIAAHQQKKELQPANDPNNLERQAPVGFDQP
ncbi:MAG: YihY/virulence factor BrkB family protein [Bacteroidota bacterium]